MAADRRLRVARLSFLLLALGAGALLLGWLWGCVPLIHGLTGLVDAAADQG